MGGSVINRIDTQSALRGLSAAARNGLRRRHRETCVIWSHRLLFCTRRFLRLRGKKRGTGKDVFLLLRLRRWLFVSDVIRMG
jgi:hypothetical protein